MCVCVCERERVGVGSTLIRANGDKYLTALAGMCQVRKPITGHVCLLSKNSDPICAGVE